MTAQELFDPRDCIHEQLSQADWDYANQQLANGVDEDTVYRRCRDWAHTMEAEAIADTLDALRSHDWDYGLE